MRWVSLVTTISMELVLPLAGGYWLDERWGTSPWLMVAGAALGFAVAAVHLVGLVRMLNAQNRSGKGKRRS